METESIYLANGRLNLSKAHEVVQFVEGEVGDANVPHEILFNELLHFPPNSFHVELQHISPLGGPTRSIPQPKGPMNLGSNNQ